MEKYISKAAVVAEIERRIKIHHDYGHYNAEQEFTKVLSFLDTIEVKDVDLEKELDTWRHNHFHGRRDKEASGEYLERVSQLDLAKHFFELGLKAQKGE